MIPFVIDASLALSWAFADQGGDEALRALDALRSRRAIAPGIWPLEVANGLKSAERRKRIAHSDAVRFLDLLQGLPIDVQPQVSLADVDRLHGLALTHDLSVYDAAYLDLVMKRHAPLASLDIALRRAVETVGGRLL